MENSFGKKNDMTAEIRKAVEDFFERDEVKHEPFDERNVARAVYGVESKFGHVTVFFHVHKDSLIIKMLLPINAEENDRPKVGEFLHRANYGLMIGNFDFDYRDGEISYRIPIFCGRDEFAPPTYEQIDFAVIIGLMMISKYGNSLIKVIFGLAEPEDAVEAAELDD